MSTAAILAKYRTNPLALGKILWPDISFYGKQKDIVRSVFDNPETIVPAAHMMGKDFIAAFTCLVFFLTRHPCRILTTSVDERQLEDVLWGEIRRFIQTSKYPLSSERGGPLVVNHLHLRKVVRGEVCGISYLSGRVAREPEGMSGHHVAQTGDGIPRTLFCGDEISGVENDFILKATEWCHRMLLIGNPYECDNYFRYSVEGDPRRDETGKERDPGGDLKNDDGTYRRKIIHISGEDSPNVRFALAQEASGIAPTNEIIIPGVLPYADFKFRSSNWTDEKKVPGLYGKFYKGETARLFPRMNLSLSAAKARTLQGVKRSAKAMGIDTGEGEADTVYTIGDELGIIEQISERTPMTDVIPDRVITLGLKYGIPPEYWVFDLGGGGKQHADVLRSRGYPVRTMAFGGSIILAPRRGLIPIEKRKEVLETRDAYKNRRAQLFGDLRDAVSIRSGKEIWGIPAHLTELIRQLSLIPLTRDGEGKLYVLPKKKKPGSNEKCLTDILGRSPDQADSAVLCLHGILYEESAPIAGAVGY